MRKSRFTEEQIIGMARNLGPAQPRGTTWKGAGGCVIALQSRQENFSRTVWMTFQATGYQRSR